VIPARDAAAAFNGPDSRCRAWTNWSGKLIAVEGADVPDAQTPTKNRAARPVGWIRPSTPLCKFGFNRSTLVVSLAGALAEEIFETPTLSLF